MSNVTALRRFRLIDGKTGEEIALPAKRVCWIDKAEITIKDYFPSKYRGREGLIVTDMNEVFVASVCGCKILEFPPTQEEIQAAAGAMK